MSDDIAAEALVRRWVDQFVIAENLCPFAARVVDAAQLRVVVCPHDDAQALALAVLEELELLQHAPEAEVATTLLAFTGALHEFDDYLDFLAFAEELLAECGLDGILQIASFHPQYVFAEVDADDVSHYTNRAPLPLLHFLRESALTRALESFPQPEAIPQRNIEHLHALGGEAVRARLQRIESGE